MLEEKIETLTKEVVLLRQALENGGTAAGTKAAEKSTAKKAPAKKAAAAADEDEDEDEAPAKKPAAKKAPAKKKTAAAEPEHDEDEVGTIFRKAAKKDKPACKKYLKKVDCEDLAELLTQPELFDAAYEFAEGVLEADDEDEDEDED